MSVAVKRPVLFINTASGGGKAARFQLVDRARERGIEPVVLAPGDDLASLARAAVAEGADGLGMAGGDGSLAAVAAVAADHDLPFVCVPAGTRNHFALDIGVLRHDLIGALDAFTDGFERRIDLGVIDGRVFLNNVSLGIYGDAVQRPRYRAAKLRTLAETVQAALGPSAETPGLRVIDDIGKEHIDPAVVLVSNNPYALDRRVAPETRPRLDGGVLGVVVLDKQVGAGRAWTTQALEVTAPAPVHAGVDGEAVTLHPRVRFTIRPAALRVRIWSGHPGASPSALLSWPPRRSTLGVRPGPPGAGRGR